MKRATTFVALFVTMFWVLQFSGCFSTPGVVISPVVEISERNPELRVISDWNLESVKPGTELEVLLFSGEKLAGKFRGLEPLAEPEYARKYSRCRAERSDLAALPALGDTIAFSDTSGKRYEGEFTGFDQGFLLVRLQEGRPATRVNIGMLRDIRLADGQSLPPGPVSSLVAKGYVPFRSSAVLSTPEGITTIPLEEISLARIAEPPGKTLLTVIGVVVGAAAFAGLIYLFGNFSHPE